MKSRYFERVSFSGIHNEPELLRQVAGGDRDAFRHFYTHCYGAVQRYIALFEPSTDRLGELTQDVFVRIWEKRVHLADVGSLKDYLFVVTRNVVFDYLRSLKQRPKLLDLDGIPEKCGEDLEREILYREYCRLAQEAMEQLPPGRRRVLKMSIEDGLSLDEIAAALHISRSGVKKRLYLASAFVRQYLRERGEISALMFVFLSIFGA